MRKQLLVMHGIWAGAAVAAFLVGSVRSGKGGETAMTGGGQAAKSRISDARRGPGESWSDGDNGGASARTGRNSGPGSRTRSLGPGEFEALARQAVRDASPISRRQAFSRLLDALTLENAQDLRAQLLEAGAEGDVWRDFNYAWGALAGRDAFDFARESDEPDMDAVLTGWASSNPREVMALLDNLPEGMEGQRDRLAGSVVDGIADVDPGLASDLVVRLAGEGVKDSERLISIVAREALRTGGPEEASRWSETLPDGSLKSSAMARVADAYVDRDQAAAAEWVQQFAEHDYAARAVEEVADGWARRNAADAVGWLEALPAGNGQISGLRSVFGDWEDRNPVAAGEYLLSMPASAQRDAAISGFSRGYAWQDPEIAIAWAQDIGDPGLRQETLVRSGQAYFRRDPASARVWLESSNLPPEAQEAVVNPPRRR